METQDSTGWFLGIEFAAQGILRRGWRIVAVRCPVPNSAEPSSRKRLSQMLTNTHKCPEEEALLSCNQDSETEIENFVKRIFPFFF